MRNELQFDGIIFWVENNIIYTNLNSKFFESYQKKDVEDIFYNSISFLSNGNYLPILIQLDHVNTYNTLSLFKTISTSKTIKNLVLSRIFLVNSLGKKALLSLYNILDNQIVPNKVYTDYNMAVRYCNNDYLFFNNVS
ncbi:hypothetical protein [Lacinutrix sp. MedPE-SW]|uniref:hypothetical protein n=1 Tax=Lacinutrix sp. MedPE-SW TaxID=1860087 RepID=UPI0009128C59|nr:hypothetical protein [Lacinutrix sp. MedPE-SW]OIQ22285.1 MAG: hypothetical protein BM549_07260 [Lacinutrix sp. MedPE-SW]